MQFNQAAALIVVYSNEYFRCIYFFIIIIRAWVEEYLECNVRYLALRLDRLVYELLSIISVVFTIT